MLLSAIAAHLTPAAARKLSRRAGPRPAAPEALAVAPVQAFTRLEPIGPLDVVAPLYYDAIAPAATHLEEIRVEVRPGSATVSLMDVPAEPVTRLFEAIAPVVTDVDGYHAAIRSHVAQAPAYGPTVQRVVRYREVGAPGERQVIMQGRLSDILRAVPDAMSREIWREACVMGLATQGSRSPIQMEVLTDLPG